jgi:cystathionine beta-synthase
VVVVIFHDHGSRYIGKLYNDDWMRDRGFLELKTVKDLMRSGKPKIISVQPANKVAEAIALMKQSDIDQLPVIHNGDVVGSITESLLFNKLLDNHDVKNQTVGEVMDKPFPVVSQDTTLERLSGIINKENPAMLTRDEAGNYHIITKYDIIFAF